MSYTLIIIIITAAISIYTFSNESWYQKLILWPKRMDSPGEYYRLLTSGFIHADWQHLLFNMFTLFFIGRYVEYQYPSAQLFLVLYLAGIVVASFPSFIKHRKDSYYRALGASGGVAAVLFAFIYIAPWQIIFIWFIPVPGIILGIIYPIYSAYMAKQTGQIINHGAHFWGAIFGFIFTFFIDPTHGKSFIENLSNPHFNF